MIINNDIELLEDKKISIALMASFVILTIQYFLLIYFNLLDTNKAGNIQLLSKLLVGLAFLYALPIVIKRVKIKLFVVYFIMILTFLLNFFIYPDNAPYLKSLVFPFFFMCLPAFVYSLSIKDYNVIIQLMKKSCLIILPFGLFITIMVFLGNSSVGLYSMTLSYYMLIPSIIYLNDFFDNPKFKSILLSMISILIILALGSRGALLCIVVFIVLKNIKVDFKNISIKKFLVNILIMGTSLFIILNLNVILMKIYNVLLGLGIYSRSILLILNIEEEIHLSGRDSIYEVILREIITNPIMGIGIGGDRKVTGGMYAHNLFLEVLSGFGIIVGSFILCTITLVIIKSFLTKNRNKYNVLIIWFSLGFVHLMVSGSYLTDIKFWIFLGLLLNGNIGKYPLYNQKLKSLNQ